MVDPLGATLGSISLLFPIYDACDRLFQGYKLTQSFGDDFRLAQVRFYQQYSRLHETSQRKVMYLNKFDNPNDMYNESHETTSMVIETLSAMRVRFEKGHKILEKYDQQGNYLSQQYQAAKLTTSQDADKRIARRRRKPRLQWGHPLKNQRPRQP